MPIHLEAPAYPNGGPDGRGWTRLAVNSMAVGVDDECALRPRNYSHLRESHADTRRARWGGYGPCIADGKCDGCPIFHAAPLSLAALTDRVLVRIGAGGSPYLMNRPEDGWASVARRWTWQDLARLSGWEIGRRHQDAHSDGFWLVRAAAPAAVSAVGQTDEEANNPRTVCVCGHTRGEHLRVSGRLLCDECDPASTDNLTCKEFEAL